MYKNNKLLLVIVISIILCFIFVDLIFNFSSVLVKNYDNFEDMELSDVALSYGFDSKKVRVDGLKINEAKSIVSVIDGKHYNIKPITVNNSNEVIIKIGPNKNNGYLTLNNGKLEIKAAINNENQLWKLIKINSISDYYKRLKTRVSNSNPKPPFYIVVSNVDENMACQYDYNSITVRPLTNFTSQIWDISGYSVNNVIDPYGNVSDVNFIDSNKLNISLNIKDPALKKLFETVDVDNSSPNNESENDSSACKFLNKKTIENACTGCDVDKLTMLK